MAGDRLGRIQELRFTFAEILNVSPGEATATPAILVFSPPEFEKPERSSSSEFHTIYVDLVCPVSADPCEKTSKFGETFGAGQT